MNFKKCYSMIGGFIFIFLCFSTARKHRNVSVEHRAAEDFWVEKTELVSGQLEGK